MQCGGGGGPESPGQAESPNTRGQGQLAERSEEQTGREAGANRNLRGVEVIQPDQRVEDRTMRGSSNRRKLAVGVAEQQRGLARFLRCECWVPSVPLHEAGTGAWEADVHPWPLPKLPGRRWRLTVPA